MPPDVPQTSAIPTTPGAARTIYTPPAEQKNVLKTPTGTEYQLQASEGLYKLRYDLLLGAVPPTIQDSTSTFVNVLDTKVRPPSIGTRLSLTTIGPRKTPVWRRKLPSLPSSPQKEHAQSPFQYNNEPSSNPTTTSALSKPINTSNNSNTSNSSNPFSNLASGNLRAFVLGDGYSNNTQSNGKDTKEKESKEIKRKKPKGNINKSNSTFIAKVSQHLSLSKRLHDRKPEGSLTIVNTGRSTQWLDLSSAIKGEPLTKLIFAQANVLCHDINETTKSSSHLDIALGFSSSDIIWYESFSQRYTRINKNNAINPQAVTCLKWVPGSDSLMIAAHLDGSLVIYDKDKDDAPFQPDYSCQAPTSRMFDGRKLPQMQIKKSVLSKDQKSNPVAYWKLTREKIHALEFSHCGHYIAVVSEDGTLKIVDFLTERLVDQYTSYYGGLTCVCWSPDDRYILTGGHDDMISLWSFQDRVLVARCVGHHSYITAVAFDAWRSDEWNYRFASVGDDCRVLFWDFSVSLLQHPRNDTIRPDDGPVLGSAESGPRSESRPNTNSGHSKSPSMSSSGQNSIVHNVEGKSQVATLPPVLSKEIDNHSLSWIGFEDDCFITACKGGHVRAWDRPEGEVMQDSGHASMFSNPFG